MDVLSLVNPFNSCNYLCYVTYINDNEFIYKIIYLLHYNDFSNYIMYLKINIIYFSNIMIC